MLKLVFRSLSNPILRISSKLTSSHDRHPISQFQEKCHANKFNITRRRSYTKKPLNQILYGRQQPAELKTLPRIPHSTTSFEMDDDLMPMVRPRLQEPEPKAVLNFEGRPEFTWDSFPFTSEHVPGSFKFISYNMHAESYAIPAPGRFTIPTPRVAHRLEYIKHDLERLAADVYCLQEVEQGYYTDHLKSFFHARGYLTDYIPNDRINDPLWPQDWRQHVDGKLIAWKTSKFTRIKTTAYQIRQMIFEKRNKFGLSTPIVRALLKRDNFLMVSVLETTHVKSTKKQIMIGNYHGTRSIDWFRSALNTIQCHLALYALQKALDDHRGTFQKQPDMMVPSPIPLIFCGDLNATPGSGSYELITKGSLDLKSDFLVHPTLRASVTTDTIEHGLSFASAYSDPSLGLYPESKMAASHPNAGMVDYIWYNPSHLTIHKTLSIPSIPASLALPCELYPSDHFPIGAQITFNNPNEIRSSR